MKHLILIILVLCDWSFELEQGAGEERRVLSAPVVAVDKGLREMSWRPEQYQALFV